MPRPLFQILELDDDIKATARMPFQKKSRYPFDRCSGKCHPLALANVRTATIATSSRTLCNGEYHLSIVAPH